MSAEVGRVEYALLKDLRPARRNPKKHDVLGIASSIKKFGFADVLIENAKTGRIVAGHGRMEALELLFSQAPKDPPKYVLGGASGWRVPVLRGVSFKNEVEAEGYLFADNRWVEIGGWDQSALAPILEAIRDRGGVEALGTIGWSMPDFEKLVAGAASAGSAVEAGAGGEGVIKQIVFPFKDKVMPGILARLARVMEVGKVDNHSEALLVLLDVYGKAGS